MRDVRRSAAAGILDAAVASDVLGGAGRMLGRECGRLCSSTAGLDTDLVMRRGAVLRVEAAARATTAHEQAKRRASIPCARGIGSVKYLQADSTCIAALVCGPTLRGHAGAISSFIWPRPAC